MQVRKQKKKWGWNTHTSLCCVYIRSNKASGAIHFTGKRPCENHTCCYAIRATSSQRMKQLLFFPPTNTHIGGLFIVIDVVDISCKAEVGDFHHVVLGHQHVASCQISVDALKH